MNENLQQETTETTKETTFGEQMRNEKDKKTKEMILDIGLKVIHLLLKHKDCLEKFAVQQIDDLFDEDHRPLLAAIRWQWGNGQNFLTHTTLRAWCKANINSRPMRLFLETVFNDAWGTYIQDFDAGNNNYDFYVDHLKRIQFVDDYKQIEKEYADKIQKALPGDKMKLLKEKTAKLAEIFQDEWSVPLPLVEDSISKLPNFPAEILNLQGLETFKAMVEETVKSTQTPMDMAAIIGLSAIGFCCSRRYQVMFKTDWVEPTNLFGVVAMESANRKSSVTDLMTLPLSAIEKDIRQNNITYNQGLDAKKIALEDAIKKTNHQLVEDNKNTDLIQKLKEYEDELAGLGNKRPTQLIFQDATPESLVDALADNEESICHVDSEGGLFAKMSGQYNDKIDLGVYLKGWDGGSIVVNRKGKSRVRLDNPLMSIALTVQPKIVTELTANQKFRNTGLVARFLFSFPKSNVGQREINNYCIPQQTKADYEKLMRGLYGLGTGGTENLFDDDCENGEAGLQTIVLSDDAKAKFKSWVDGRIEKRLKGDMSEIQDWGGKLAGEMLRVAGILHCIRYANNNPSKHSIDADVIEAVIVLADYLIEHCKYALGQLEQSSSNDLLIKIVAKIKKLGKSKIFARDIYKDLNLKSWDCKQALQDLEDVGYVRYDYATREYHINPKVFE